jgi:Putative peptidoglycan binding domain
MEALRTGLLAGLTLLGVLALSALTSAQAADRAGNYAVKGFGQANCVDLSRIAASSKPQELAPFLQWLAGYLTAANAYEKDTYDLLSWQSDGVIAASLIGYCRANPKVAVGVAAAKMVQSLRATRVVASGAFQTLTLNGQQIRFYDETVVRMKRLLAAKAGYNGPMDRALNTPALREALLRFQATRKIPQTGLPDEATLVSLFGTAGSR